MVRVFFLLAVLVAGPAQAQTLTPEEIAAMVDQRVNALNPYAELLNDPDPARSLAAMEIMLETGDTDLTRMALEFGLFSPNPVVRRTAVEAYLRSDPTLILRFVGGEEPDRYFQGTAEGFFSGSTTPDNIGYWRVPVGGYSEELGCFLRDGDDENCFVTVSADGVYLSAFNRSSRILAGQTQVNDEGMLAGFATILNVSAPVPVTIQLVE